MTTTTVDDEPTTDTPSPPPAPRRRRRTGIRPPVWFLIPAILVYTAIVVIPNIRGYYYSFTDWNGFTPDVQFVGFGNYTRIFDDPGTLQAFSNTFVLTLIGVIGQNVLGLLLALGCNTKLKSRFALRLVFFLPVVLTPLVTAYLWAYLMNPEGTINDLLSSLGLEGWRQDWLGDPGLALWSVAIAMVWQGVGLTMVIYLAGLQGVPQELIEASAIDGAGPGRRLLMIILPMINASVVINIFLTVTSGLKTFDLVFAMTHGGPAGSTETLPLIIYQSAFVDLDFPTSVAQGVVLTIIVSIVAIAQVRLTTRKEA
ncbi:carbohydrate ABC transporter permease [Ruania alba]|uniref:Carbohydrate ABC transporter membrane protein 1, CUT1 family n=1 Tax=Ruania alba TaxID=648782 RepID=A0A1H5L106_9MICO|nr:sugar ABC transporter permease [Ruania alba]SEE70011.1 carbohydrate ABC transporter membrane protein 1, CUT1 family [Ruania alba]